MDELRYRPGCTKDPEHTRAFSKAAREFWREHSGGQTMDDLRARAEAAVEMIDATAGSRADDMEIIHDALCDAVEAEREKLVSIIREGSWSGTEEIVAAIRRRTDTLFNRWEARMKRVILELPATFYELRGMPPSAALWEARMADKTKAVPSIVQAKDFLRYCEQHPEQRFWQALRNWSGVAFVGVSNDGAEWLDTFHFTDDVARRYGGKDAR